VSGFEEYHKIETLFERDKQTFTVDPTKLKSLVLGTITKWDVTEKIDGTNVRVMLSGGGEGKVSFGGRTNNAQMPGDLIAHLIDKFSEGKMREVLWIDQTPPSSVVLYGEGYGAGIQKIGGLYRPDKSFILFDVLVAGKYWLDQEDVASIAARLDVPVVPYLGRMTLDEIVDFVKYPFPSKIGTAPAEGIVARPIEPLFDKRGNRIIIKLKTKDFVSGKR
jgi:hypothetical protein